MEAMFATDSPRSLQGLQLNLPEIDLFILDPTMEFSTAEQRTGLYEVRATHTSAVSRPDSA